MEDLYFNSSAAFTKWVTTKGLLQESFVVVDVGVQGDANARWNLLGEHLVLHGFDAIQETIKQLRRSNAGRSNRHYYDFAISETDGEATFYFNAANPTASSMYSQGPSRFDVQLSEQARTVTTRRLDTLYADGTIPRADFLKVDVEGFEKSAFMGARNLLSAGVLGVETETNFGVSPTYPKSHFSAISEILVEHCFVLFDLGFNRMPRPTFTQALARRGIHNVAGRDLGKPATFNVLFCRDLIDERDSPHHYITAPRPVTVDQIIKMMIIYELHGLNDIAVDTAVRFTDVLGQRLDVDEAIGLLADADCRPSAIGESGLSIATLQGGDPRAMEERVRAAEEYVRSIKASTSWRITAPLRSLKGFINGITSRA